MLIMFIFKQSLKLSFLILTNSIVGETIHCGISSRNHHCGALFSNSTVGWHPPQHRITQTSITLIGGMLNSYISSWWRAWISKIYSFPHLRRLVRFWSGEDSCGGLLLIISYENLIDANLIFWAQLGPLVRVPGPSRPFKADISVQPSLWNNHHLQNSILVVDWSLFFVVVFLCCIFAVSCCLYTFGIINLYIWDICLFTIVYPCRVDVICCYCSFFNVHVILIIFVLYSADFSCSIR